MKTAVAKWLLFIILLIALGGCAATELVRIKSHGQREDVFKEVQDKGEIPKGYADLMIQCSIKTHLEGEYLLERGGFHGKPNYPFLLTLIANLSHGKLTAEKRSLQNTIKRVKETKNEVRE